MTLMHTAVLIVPMSGIESWKYLAAKDQFSRRLGIECQTGFEDQMPMALDTILPVAEFSDFGVVWLIPDADDVHIFVPAHDSHGTKAGDTYPAARFFKKPEEGWTVTTLVDIPANHVGWAEVKMPGVPA